MSHRNRLRRAQRRAGADHRGRAVTRTTRLAVSQALDDLATEIGEALAMLAGDDLAPQTRAALTDALGHGLDDLLADVRAIVSPDPDPDADPDADPDPDSPD